MTSPIWSDVIEAKLAEIGQDEPRAWSGCVAIWVRTDARATAGWDRWPAWRVVTRRLLTQAVLHAIGNASPPPKPVDDVVAGFDVEDDGTPEWQAMIDLISMLRPALSGAPATACLRTSMDLSLEGLFAALANELASQAGRPISHADARHLVPATVAWSRELSFVSAL